MAIGRDEIAARLEAGVLVLDGATGTELERRGLPTPAPLWSSSSLQTHPEAVGAVHRGYVAAGADIVVANTFRTNVRALRRAGCVAQGATLNGRAVDLVRQAIDVAGGSARVIVAASVAPVEDCYRPERVPEEAALREEHGVMMGWLAAAEPDLVWIETMNSACEARVAAEAAGSAGLAFCVSFVVAESGALLSGESLAEALAAVEPFGPLAVGVNCVPPNGVTRALQQLGKLTARPMAAYGHIGNRRPIRGWSYAATEVTPTEYAAEARRWVELGARVVGGCCGTTPGHIEAVRAAV